MKNGKPKTIKGWRAAVLSWVGLDVDLLNTAFWKDWSGADNYSGANVNEKSVMSLSAAWGCVRLISETISTLPLRLYKRTPTGPEEAKEHRLYSVLSATPNQYSTATTFWEAVTSAMLLRGGGPCRKLLYNGRVVGLEFLRPDNLNVRVDPHRRKREYVYTDMYGQQKVIPDKEVFIIPGFSLDGFTGCSVLQYGANVFGSAISAETAAGKTFDNGLMGTSYYTIDRILKQNQREDFHKLTESFTGAMNAGKQPLLEGGMTMGKIGISPKDAQLIESRGYSVEEICRWFRVPTWMVQHSSDGQTRWGTGLEQEMIAFLLFTLRPWLTRIVQAVNKDLLTPAERTQYFVQFNTQDLLRGDTKARTEFYGTLVDKGIFTRDEVRELEGMSRRGGNADELTVQSAMTTLDSLGTANDPNAIKARIQRMQNYISELSEGLQNDQN